MRSMDFNTRHALKNRWPTFCNVEGKDEGGIVTDSTDVQFERRPSSDDDSIDVTCSRGVKSTDVSEVQSVRKPAPTVVNDDRSGDKSIEVSELHPPKNSDPMRDTLDNDDKLTLSSPEQPKRNLLSILTTRVKEVRSMDLSRQQPSMNPLRMCVRE